MNGSKLRQLMEFLEQAGGTYTIQALARELDVSAERAEGLVDFWIRKGKIRVSSGLSGCSRCGSMRECPLVFNAPRVYELNGKDAPGQFPGQIPPCSC